MTIKTVWQGVRPGDDPELWDGLEFQEGVTYHTTPEDKLIFELDDGFLSIGVDGCVSHPSQHDIEASGFNLYPCEDLAELVFTGQQIHKIRQSQDGWIVSLTDFNLMIIKHEEYENPGLSIEVPLSGFDHLLKKCECGSTPQFLMDWRGDFYVECPECHRYSIVGYMPDRIIEDWNQKITTPS